MNAENKPLEDAPVGADDGSAGVPAGADERAPFWKRRKVRLGFLGAGVFIIGMAVGSLTTSHIIMHTMRRGFRDPSLFASRMLSHMRHDLDLTADQEAQIKVILEESLGGLADSFTKAHDDMTQRVNAILTPDQRKIHNERIARMRRRFLGCHDRPDDGPKSE